MAHSRRESGEVCTLSNSNPTESADPTQYRETNPIGLWASLPQFGRQTGSRSVLFSVLFCTPFLAVLSRYRGQVEQLPRVVPRSHIDPILAARHAR